MPPGAWSYTLDDSNATVQALGAGATLHELVTIATADGTTRQIDITITGANDAAVITGTVTGAVTEKSGVANGTAGVATATGALSATDVDSSSRSWCRARSPRLTARSRSMRRAHGATRWTTATPRSRR